MIVCSQGQGMEATTSLTSNMQLMWQGLPAALPPAPWRCAAAGSPCAGTPAPPAAAPRAGRPGTRGPLDPHPHPPTAQRAPRLPQRRNLHSQAEDSKAQNFKRPAIKVNRYTAPWHCTDSPLLESYATEEAMSLGQHLAQRALPHPPAGPGEQPRSPSAGQMLLGPEMSPWARQSEAGCCCPAVHQTPAPGARRHLCWAVQELRRPASPHLHPGGNTRQCERGGIQL